MHLLVVFLLLELGVRHVSRVRHDEVEVVFRPLEDVQLETLHHGRLRPKLYLSNRVGIIGLRAKDKDLAFLEPDDKLFALGTDPLNS